MKCHKPYFVHLKCHIPDFIHLKCDRPDFYEDYHQEHILRVGMPPAHCHRARTRVRGRSPSPPRWNCAWTRSVLRSGRTNDWHQFDWQEVTTLQHGTGATDSVLPRIRHSQMELTGFMKINMISSCLSVLSHTRWNIYKTFPPSPQSTLT